MTDYYRLNSVGEVVIISELNAPSNARFSLFYIQKELLTDDYIANAKIVREYYRRINSFLKDIEKNYFEVNDESKNMLSLLFKIVLINVILLEAEIKGIYKKPKNKK